MKKQFNLILLFLLPLFAVSQNLSDTKTYQEAVELAESRQKPILLIINFRTSAGFLNKGIKDAVVVKKLKTNFVIFEGDFSDAAIRKIANRFKVNWYPTFLFLHSGEDLFHSDFGDSSDKGKYLNMIDKALLKSKEKSMSAIAKAYAANTADTTLLKQFINKRRQNGITDNAELIEEYVKHLKFNEFNNYKTVLFILEAGPILNGNAHKFAQNNTSIIDKIYKDEPSEKRIAINNTIIDNTHGVAIKTKNLNMAYQLSNFIRGTWKADPIQGNKAAETRMLSYYLAVKDTATYLRTATHFYDKYYMSLSVDSIKKIDSKNRETRMTKARQQAFPQTPTRITSKANTKPPIRNEIVSISSVVNLQSNDLINAAYRFYQTGTKNTNYLVKAMTWSKRAIELDPNWSNYNTLAYVYYAMDIQNEALATQKIAIDLAKKNGASEQDLLSLTKAYEKMKSKTL